MQAKTALIAGLSILLLACKGRLPLSASYEDSYGHRLFLFEDSLFFALLGDDGSRFYRRSQHSFGYWRFEGDSNIVLNSRWNRNVKATVVPDTVRMNKGLAIRLVDNRGHPDWNTELWLDLYDRRDSLLRIVESYGCYYTDAWSPWIRIVDKWDLIEVDTIWLPDSGKHWNTVKLDWWSIDHSGDLIILREYELRRLGTRYVPSGPWDGIPQLDPMIDTLSPRAPTDRKNRRSIERRGWELKKDGRIW